MSIIDAELAKSLNLPLEETKPIPVSGIGSKHVSTHYVNLDVYFRGSDNVAKLTMEAHLK